MAIVSLKSLIGKKNETAASLLSLIVKMQASVWIEDNNGNILLGQALSDAEHCISIKVDDEVIGYVKGNGATESIASILSLLIQKETERKKLGAEVLNLYKEINIIFNFSEKLAETIDPDVIIQMALDEAIRCIKSSAGVALLWDEEKQILLVPAIAGEPLFNVKKIKRNVELLTNIGLSGQSEIMTDISSLSEKEIINNNVQTIIYASLKVKHRIMGAIILASKENITYSAGDLKLLVTLALQSSSAIESALQYEKNIKEARDREETMRRIYEATNKFVPHEFIKSLGHNLITDVKLGDQVEKIVTVLFTDIRDFTGISEKMTPSENFQFVSSFNEKLGPIIRKHNGFINQYLGDSIMAIFPENPIDALHAAVGMHQAINELNELRITNGLSKIKAGIGMHTGPLVMGITGDEKRLDAATISDTVNTAARIESLTKYYQSPLLLSHETMQYAESTNDFIFRQLGSVRLKGKAKLLNIVECINAFDDGIKAKKSNTLPDFTNAMNAYLNGEFETATNLFDSVIALDPEDHTALFFGSNARKYIQEGAPENWTGTVEMMYK